MSNALLAVLLVVGLIIGSLFWIMPSSGERRRMKLRQSAYTKGFKVRRATCDEFSSYLNDPEEVPLWYYYKFERRDSHKTKGIYYLEPETSKLSLLNHAGYNSGETLEVFPSNIRMCVFRDSEKGFLWDEKLLQDEFDEVLCEFDKL